MHRAYSIPLRWLRVFVAPLVVAFAVVLVPTAASAASRRRCGTSRRRADPDEAIQGNVFLNNNITIHTGDTVDWTIKSGEPHTISFFAPVVRAVLRDHWNGLQRAAHRRTTVQCDGGDYFTRLRSTPRHVRPAL